MQIDTVKEKIAEIAVHDLPEKGVVGLGTGTTSAIFIRKVADFFHQKKPSLRFVATSPETEKLAIQLNLPLIDFFTWEQYPIDITFDGADAVDEEGSAIKGAGGALLREKIVAFASKKFILLIDERKWHKPYTEVPLPIEILRFGHGNTIQTIRNWGFIANLRMVGENPFCTADGNYIVDVTLQQNAPSIPHLDEVFRKIPGVIETGFFYHFASEIIIGYGNGGIEKRQVQNVSRFRPGVF